MTDQPYQFDLTNCDREPIHRLGAVQPFGFLLAITADWLIARASANLDRYVGMTAADVLGRPVTTLLNDEAIHAFRNRLALLGGTDAVERLFGVVLLRDRADLYDCALHMSDGLIVLECEPSDAEDRGDPANLIRSMMARLDQAPDLTGFFREGARQVRALTGFDRVMVYRFDRDGSGEVVAEAVRPGIGTFLGLHYPASDIPRQARELYLRTPFRIIADVTAAPVGIEPVGEALDLSLSTLRSVSPIHIEYLVNMGVGASLSISIIIGGQLWGLFACHHYGARLPGFNRRTISELFGHMFALKLESRHRSETAEYESRARAAGERLLSALAVDSTSLDNPGWLGSKLRDVVPCDGLAIVIDDRVATSGSTPPAATIPALVRRLHILAAAKVFTTDYIASLTPEAESYAPDASGLLAIPISRLPRDYILLFRQERIRTVDWGGDPHKPVSFGPLGARLTPRESFAAWKEEVRHRAEPFTDAQIRVAEALRASLIEVVLRMSEDARAERHRATERQELLIAELNHRVRNILALIRGLVRQSRAPNMSAAEYVTLLEGRIESMARAHDQITQDNWAPARLDTLIETEATAYLHGKRDRLALEGPPVFLAPAAFTTLALVAHELVTNSAKYGSLSRSGEVQVAWRIDEQGDLVIDWREIGGPPVQAPSRQGFGTTIIQRSIPYDLGGRARIDYRLTGVEASFTIPSRYIAEADQSGTTQPVARALVEAEPVDGEGVSGTILLVEDSLIIAMDAEDILMRLGAERVMTAATLQQALGELDRERPDLAVLDVNLGSETSLPLADRLAELNVPYVFATGYGEQIQLPAQHAGAPVVQKPYTPAALVRALRSAANPA